MHYFLTHIGYIIVVAVVIALLAFAAVILAEKNEAKRNVDDERCDFTLSLIHICAQLSSWERTQKWMKH